jgi:HTH-type transcriptional regulator / antitoxin HigA
MKTVTVPVIKSEEDLKRALARIEELMRSDNKDVDDEIQILGLVIHAYESEHIRFGDHDPIEVLEFVLAERGLKDRDLIPYIGSQPRVSEILSRKRRLTIDMIRNLSEGLGIPAGALMGNGHKISAA